MLTPEELAVLAHPHAVSPKSAIVQRLVCQGLLDRCMGNVWRTTAGREVLRAALSKQQRRREPLTFAERLF